MLTPARLTANGYRILHFLFNVALLLSETVALTNFHHAIDLTSQGPVPSCLGGDGPTFPASKLNTKSFSDTSIPNVCNSDIPTSPYWAGGSANTDMSTLPFKNSTDLVIFPSKGCTDHPDISKDTCTKMLTLLVSGCDSGQDGKHGAVLVDGCVTYLMVVYSSRQDGSGITQRQAYAEMGYAAPGCTGTPSGPYNPSGTACP